MSLSYKCVLFCEDIRQELGGKMSLMGVLGNKLLVPQFPLHMPKFCLLIEWAGHVGKENVNMRIIPPSGQQPKELVIEVIGQPGIVSRSLVVMNGFSFDQAGDYVFEFEHNMEIIGSETFTIEAYKGPSENDRVIN